MSITNGFGGLSRGQGGAREVRSARPVTSETIIPPVLYLPIYIGVEGQQSVVVREQATGTRALLAFTALDRLATQCGNEQPWIMVQTQSLGYIKDAHPFDVVSFDPRIDERLVRDGKML
ncbi:SAV_915 family protein [Mycetocola saprophilus]|uniref:SAV_915 family protein n=1 Tax=Mycetocola saprophilus TaxID=76636 RepID=UPI003BF16A1B